MTTCALQPDYEISARHDGLVDAGPGWCVFAPITRARCPECRGTRGRSYTPRRRFREYHHEDRLQLYPMTGSYELPPEWRSCPRCRGYGFVAADGCARVDVDCARCWPMDAHDFGEVPL